MFASGTVVDARRISRWQTNEKIVRTRLAWTLSHVSVDSCGGGEASADVMLMKLSCVVWSFGLTRTR